jgi:hypothetical protein
MTQLSILNAFAWPGEPEEASIKLRLIQRLATYSEVIIRQKYELAHGRILLVGDRPGPSRPNDAHYHFTPFFSLKNSSMWLNKQLEKYQIDEAALAWLNSTRFDDTPENIQLITLLRPSKIIALGEAASQWLDQHEHVRVNHPQYQKRFLSTQQYQLIQLLVDATKSIN